jgi:sulfur-carrier protein adenylyltransferase/sulfurtransferase
MLLGLFKKLLNMNSGVPEITPTELKARMDAGDALVLVDVRDLREATISDLPAYGDKRLMPTGEFPRQMNDLDPEQSIVVYCRSGARSAWAVRLLMNHGFEKVLNLKGGVLGWRQEVDPSLQSY